MLVGALAMLETAPIRLEAEDARLVGPRVATARGGFSGRGYVTDVTRKDARIVWTVRARAGVYLVRVRFATPEGGRATEISADGVRASATLPDTHGAWSTKSAGRIELKDGVNEVAVERGWGSYDVDWLELAPAPAPRPLRRPPARLCDPGATPAARGLYARLLRDYGPRTWSGQYDGEDNAWLRRTLGRTPAIYGSDLIDYSPARVARFGKGDEPVPADRVPGWIAAARAGQDLTLSWHWTAPFGLLDTKERPWSSGFYTDATSFDVARAMRAPDSEERKGVVRDLDAIAVQLRRLQDAGVPVLWRPLHEADGGWFWWGAKGPEPARWLYRFAFDRLTRVRGLHNLIWVWNSPKPDWYPGDDVVDVVSVDLYPTDRRDALSAVWEELLGRFDGRKPLALAEFPGAPDVARMRRLGVRWMYFVSWLGDVGPKSTPLERLRATYALPSVVNAK